MNEWMDFHENLFNYIFHEAIFKPGLDVEKNYVILFTTYNDENPEDPGKNVAARFPIYNSLIRGKEETLGILETMQKRSVLRGHATIERVKRNMEEQNAQGEALKDCKDDDSAKVRPAIIFVVVVHEGPDCVDPKPFGFTKPLLSPLVTRAHHEQTVRHYNRDDGVFGHLKGQNWVDVVRRATADGWTIPKECPCSDCQLLKALDGLLRT